MSIRRTGARLLAVPTLAAIALLAVSGPASAHVTAEPSTTAAGAYTIVDVSLSHGCEGSPTTKVEVQIPEEILSVKPTRNAFWDVKTTQEKLDEPITDAHGNEITERDALVTYTAKSALPDGIRDSFELSLQLPEEEGTTVAFPAIQTCEKGETAWTEIAADGQDPDELEHPAPAFTTTAAEDEGHGAETAADDSADSEDSSDSMSTLGVVGLGAGVLGLLTGGAALAQVRRRS